MTPNPSDRTAVKCVLCGKVIGTVSSAAVSKAIKGAGLGVLSHAVTSAPTMVGVALTFLNARCIPCSDRYEGA